jgi:hypothetical protein
MELELSQAAQAEIARIAQSVLDIETLETRNSYDQYFHEVSVWGLKKALETAYRAGMRDPRGVRRR